MDVTPIKNVASNFVLDAAAFSRKTYKKFKDYAPNVLDIATISEKVFAILKQEFPSHVIYTAVKTSASDLMTTILLIDLIKRFTKSFSNEDIDSYEFKKTIFKAIKLYDSQNPSIALSELAQAKKVQSIYDSVMNEENHSLKEAKDRLQKTIRSLYANDKTATDKILTEIKLQKQRNSPLQVVSIVCLTITTVANVPTLLKNWHILDLGKIVLSIGHNPVFEFVMNSNIPFLTIVSAAGLLATVLDSTYLVAVHLKKWKEAISPEDKQEAWVHLSKALISLSKSSLGLTITIGTYLFTATCPGILILVVIAKTMGLIITFSNREGNLPQLPALSPIFIPSSRPHEIINVRRKPLHDTSSKRPQKKRLNAITNRRFKFEPIDVAMIGIGVSHHHH